MKHFVFFFFLSIGLVACETDKTNEKQQKPEQTEEERVFEALKSYEDVYIFTLSKADALADSIFSRLDRIEDTLTDPKYLTSQDIISDAQINALWEQALADPSIVQARVRVARNSDGTRFDFKLDPNLLIGIEEQRFDTLLFGIDLTGGYGVSTTDREDLRGVKLVEVENASGDRNKGLTIYLRMFMAYENKNAPG